MAACLGARAEMGRRSQSGVPEATLPEVAADLSLPFNAQPRGTAC